MARQSAAEALEVVTEVQTDVGRSALIAGLQQQVHLPLNQAAKSARDLPFELTTLIELGHPVEKAIERAGSEQYGTVVLRIRPGEREEHDHLSEQMARDLDDVHVLVV